LRRRISPSPHGIQTACTDPGVLQGVNCNDLLDGH
jgi:hypothetical protein